ncbi:MAG: FixH family protein [Anaerolineales bacterium]|nr:FixH family protein [Anaerolineales bacterium]
MAKKIGTIAIVVLIAFAVFAISMRRSHMMMGGAGVQQDLVAVSKDGAPIPPSADVTAITGELPKSTAAQKSGGMIVSLALNPYPPSAGAPGKFDVTLTDLDGKSIDDAVISLDLTMPSMWMPPNKPAMEFVSDGKYHAEAPFTMRGGWRIEVIITRGGTAQSAFFDVGL